VTSVAPSDATLTHLPRFSALVSRQSKSINFMGQRSTYAAVKDAHIKPSEEACA
jgi:hypothetical protein